MQTVTFYSYKGGVGRTLALRNVAQYLAERGKRVFVLDGDLEAPGLHYKLLDQARRDRMKPGFVDLAFEYFQRDGFRPIHEHVEEIPVSGGGTILFMPAGQPLLAEYWTRLVKIRWPDRFYEEYGEGFLFLLELKRRIEVECTPDFLLIDARTGVTEVGGVALTLLPDTVVFLFVNNEESKEGTREILRSIPRTLPPDERIPTVVPVLTRVPARDDALLERLRGYFNEPPDDVIPPRVDRVLVLRSDRELERDEQAYLEGDPNQGERLLWRDSYELFQALELKDKDLAPAEARALAEEADVERARGNPGAEVDKRREALEAAERAFGLENPEYAEKLGAYAEALWTAQRGEEALEALLKLEELYPHSGITDIRNLGKLAGNIVHRSAELGRFNDVAARLDDAIRQLRQLGGDERVKFITELKDLYEKSPGKRHHSYASVLRELWSALIEEKRYDEAQEALRDALKFFGALGDEGRTEKAEAQQAWAGLLVRRKEYAQAEAPLTEALNAFMLAFGPGSSRVDEVLKELESVLRHLGRDKGADAMASRAKAMASRAKARAPSAPSAPPERLPARRPSPARGGPERVSFSVPIVVVTPILGGATRPREIDNTDIIRAPSLRGQLRFWWRALYGGQLSGEPLYLAERHLWGGAGDEDGGRSAVEIRVRVKPGEEAAIDESPIRLYGKDATAGAYALWPAREARGEQPRETAPRRAPGTRFQLELICPRRDEATVRNTVRAWLLFGGYGGRTRRGLGSFSVDRERQAEWLPAAATRDALTALFGEDVLAPILGRALDDLPLLRGAGLRAAAPVVDPMAAWTTALQWLSDFRQGQPPAGAPGAHDPRYARVRGDSWRPGRSNWPESDKVRRLSGPGPWEHAPRHHDRPAWPRAGFGLPIVAQFQRKDRNGARYARPEPANYEIRWYDERDRKARDRLASPLIVKAMPLADGRFAPCALWLHRGYPKGKVGLKESDARSERSKEDFDRLVAQGDKVYFEPLEAGQKEVRGRRLRAAFFGWLERTSEVVVVAP